VDTLLAYSLVSDCLDSKTMSSSRPVVLSIPHGSPYTNLRATRSAESVPQSLTSGPSAPSTVSLSDTPSLRRPRSQSLERILGPPSPKSDLPYDDVEDDFDQPRASPTVSFHSNAHSHVSTPTVRSVHRRQDSGTPTRSSYDLPRVSFDRPRESSRPAPPRVVPNPFAPAKRRLRVDSGNAAPPPILPPPAGFPYRNSSMLGARSGPKRSDFNQADSDEDVDLDLSWEASVDVVVDIDEIDDPGGGSYYRDDPRARQRSQQSRRTAASASGSRDRPLSVDIGLASLAGPSLRAENGVPTDWARGNRSAPLRTPADWAQGWSYNRTAPVTPSEVEAEAAGSWRGERKSGFPLSLFLDREHRPMSADKGPAPAGEAEDWEPMAQSRPVSSVFPLNYILHPFQRSPPTSLPTSPGVSTFASASTPATSPLFHSSPLVSPIYSSAPTSPERAFADVKHPAQVVQQAMPTTPTTHGRSTSVSFSGVRVVGSKHAHSLSSPVTRRRKSMGKNNGPDPMGPYKSLVAEEETPSGRPPSPEIMGYSAFTTPARRHPVGGGVDPGSGGGASLTPGSRKRVPMVKISSPGGGRRPSPSTTTTTTSGSQNWSTPSTGRSSRSVAASIWALGRPAPLHLVPPGNSGTAATSARDGGGQMGGDIHVPSPQEREEQLGEWQHVNRMPLRPSRSTFTSTLGPLVESLDAFVPARSLFFLGFLLGPWCWLIGAFYLRRVDGELYGLRGNVCRCAAASSSSSSAGSSISSGGNSPCTCVAERARTLRTGGVMLTGRGVDVDGGEPAPLDPWVGANRIASAVAGLGTVGLVAAAIQAMARVG
jgi:hypothetical protein